MAVTYTALSKLRKIRWALHKDKPHCRILKQTSYFPFYNRSPLDNHWTCSFTNPTFSTPQGEQRYVPSYSTKLHSSLQKHSLLLTVEIHNIPFSKRATFHTQQTIESPAHYTLCILSTLQKHPKYHCTYTTLRKNLLKFSASQILRSQL